MKRIVILLLFVLPIFAPAQNNSLSKIIDRPKNLSDSALLDVVQRQTFRYFWDFGHPTSGLARERSNVAFDYGNEVVTTGGSGFGIMALIAADSRKFIPHDQAVDRMIKMVDFLVKADSYHGAFPHWLN